MPIAHRIIAAFVLLASQCLLADDINRLAPSLTKQKSLPLQKNAGAEVLHAVKQTVVDSDFLKHSVLYYSIRINDVDAARDYGRISLKFNHFYTDVQLQFANVLGSDNKIKALSSDATQEKIGGSQDFYDESSQLVFSLPDISPGSIIEFQYISKQIKHSIPNYYSDTSSNIWFQPTTSGRSGRADFVHKATYELLLDKQLPVEIENFGPLKIQYKKQRKGTDIKHRWTWKNQPSMPIEPSMPWYEKTMSKVRVASTRDWKVLDQWMWELVQDKSATNAEIQNIANELVKLSATEQEKIKAVYGYLQKNFRYVYAHLGRGGYEPHFASEIINRMYGDCKDQTILAVALLNALGVEAYPALIVTPRADRPNMDLVALYFDHMIVWIPGEDGNEIWLDTTGERTLYPGISNYLDEQPAFIIDGKGGQNTTLTRLDYPNHAKMELDYQLNTEGNLLVNMNIQFYGSVEQNIRNWWTHIDDRETALHNLIKTPFADLKPEAKVNAKVLNHDNLWKPVTLKGSIDFGKVFDNNKDPYYVDSHVSQILRIFSELDTLMLPETRKANFVSYQDLSYQLVVNFKAPDKFLSSLVQSPLDFKNPYFNLRQSAIKTENGFRVTMNYQRNQFEVDTNDYSDFYQLSQQLLSDENWRVAFYKPSMIAARHQPNSVANSDGKELTVAGYIAQARTMLSSAQFDAAELACRNAIAIDKENGEAWYVLGVSQGFQARLEASSNSFSKAKSLGYQP